MTPEQLAHGTGEGSPAPPVNPPFEVILASASPRRRELVALLGLPIRAEAAEVGEVPLDDETPSDTAARLAVSKARAVALCHPDALVVGCDTVVALQNRVLGKPADAAEARAMLSHLRNRWHEVYTGVALVGRGHEVIQVARTAVRMRDYTDVEMDAYVASGDPLDKAGAYAIQQPAFGPVASWEGCYANVMGLPLCHVVRALRAWEIVPPQDVPAACQAFTGQPCSVYPSILGPRPSAKLRKEAF
jgi:septum formation protein